MKRNEVIIPLVQQDASREETILQIAFALESVETYVKTVFKNVEDGIVKEKTRIQDLRDRCKTAKAKVEKIRGINKSIQVFSSSKYPVPPRNVFFENFNNSFNVKEPDLKIERKLPGPDRCSLKEKFKFYHVRDSVHTLKKAEETASYEGLGPIPENIKNVTSLLLFNTTENLYKEYRLVDPLSFNSTLESSVKGEKENELEPPPASITSKERLGLKNVHSYFYTPISQVVPDLQAPLDLPFLSGIAGDLRYDENALEENPGANVRIEDDKIEFLEEKITLDLPKVEIINSVSNENLVPPPPPPPPPPPINLEIDNSIIEPDISKPLIKSRKPDFSVEVGNQLVSSVSDVTDMRANLMEAIRNAGGKPKLKNIQKKVESSSSSKKPMSLMDDLHDKLMRRRKGISGKLESPEGNILDKVATMIPPPPTKEVDSEVEEDGEEWDD